MRTRVYDVTEKGAVSSLFYHDRIPVFIRARDVVESIENNDLTYNIFKTEFNIIFSLTRYFSMILE